MRSSWLAPVFPADPPLTRLFGIKLAAHSFIPVLAELVGRLRETHVLALLLGVGFIILLEALRRLWPKLPGALVVFVA